MVGVSVFFACLDLSIGVSVAFRHDGPSPDHLFAVYDPTSISCCDEHWEEGHVYRALASVRDCGAVGSHLSSEGCCEAHEAKTQAQQGS